MLHPNIYNDFVAYNSSHSNPPCFISHYSKCYIYYSKHNNKHYQLTVAITLLQVALLNLNVIINQSLFSSLSLHCLKQSTTQQFAFAPNQNILWLNLLISSYHYNTSIIILSTCIDVAIQIPARHSFSLAAGYIFSNQ
jgi:hypothetical protein